MYGNFEAWLSSNAVPYETYDEARERYDYLYGDLEPVEFTSDPEPERVDENYIADPDTLDQLSAGWDDMQASYGSAVAGPVSGFLSDYVSEDLGDTVKSYGEDVRDRNLEESALVARPKSREEILIEDPDSWYKYLPEDTPTGHEIIRSTPTSLAAAGVALPAALAGGYVAGAAGLAGLGTMAVGGATGMIVGNAASSLQVAGESYERAKNDPLIRKELGIDPDKDFKDLSPEDQQTMDRFATDLSQNAFGHRVYTSGAVEMISYIPYGGVLARYIADTGLGTASEVWDRSLFTEDATNTLVEYGMPKDKAMAFQKKILDAGPGLWETFWPALVQEAATGGVFTGAETVITDHRVNSLATSTKFQLERVAEAEKAGEQASRKEAEDNTNAFNEGFRGPDGTEVGAAAAKARAEGNREAATQANADFVKTKQEERKLEKIEEDRLKEEVKAATELRSEQDRAEKEREAQVDADAQEEIDNSPKYQSVASLSRKPEIIKLKEILDKPGNERSANDLVEIDSFRRKYGLQGKPESELLGLPDKKIFTQEETEKKKKRVKKKVKKEQTKKYGSRFNFAKNLEPDKPTKWQKFMQVLPFAGKKEQEGEVKISKRVMTEVLDDISKRFKKLRGKYIVVDDTDAKSIAQMLTDGKRKVEGKKKGSVVKATPEENLAFAEDALKTGKAWTFGGKIFMNADGITGKTNKEIYQQIVQLGMFHEPIAHLGLKGYLSKGLSKAKGKKKVDKFLDDFYKTNEKDISKWAGVPAYLDEGQDLTNIPDSKKRELAEEYLANNFVEFGVRDPNIVAKLADSLTRGTLSVFGRERVTLTQAQEILAEVQRQYLGGKRNIVTGDFFDQSNWLKPKKDTTEEKKEELEEKITKVGRGGQPLSIDRTTMKRTFYKEKKGDQVRFAKRISTPEKRKVWQKLNKANPVPEIKRRDIELTALAQKLEKGEIEFEEYRSEYEKKFPIKTFNKVPNLSSGTQIAGAINQGQYDKGKLIGEDSDLAGGMDALVRFDVNSMEKYNVGVVTAVSPQAKGSHYGKAAHLVAKKDGTPVKMVTKNKKKVLGIAAGEGKFPMAYFKGEWKDSSAPQIKKLAQKLINKPNWIQVGMEPKRQSSFYARETKEINGKTIEAGSPLDTAQEVLQVGMFAIAKNPTTKAVPEFTSAEGTEVRFAKQKSKKLYTRKEKKLKFYHKQEDAALRNPAGLGISISAMEFVDTSHFEDPLALNKPHFAKIMKTYGKAPNKGIRKLLPKGTVVLNTDGVKEFIKTKGDSETIGHIRFSKDIVKTLKLSPKLQKELIGQNVVALVGDRLKRESYIPLHKKKSKFIKLMEYLHGGPDYAFDKSNMGEQGRAAWASGEGRITSIANAIRDFATQYGAIVVGSPEQHMSNMDVWNVMWGETLDASKLGVVQEDGTLKKDKDGNIILTDMNWINSFITTGKLTKDGNIVKGNNGKALIEQTYFVAEEDPNDKTKTIKVEYDLIPKKLKNKITDFESLMREGKNLTFDSRKAVLLKLFGTPVNNYKKGAQIETIANGVPLHRIIKLTSAFPDAQVGDLVGLVKFEVNEDGTAKTGKAKDMGVPSHPSYDTVIMGEGIARFDTPVKLDDWGRDWLMTDRESKQKPFFQKDQKAFEDRIGAILHTPAMLEFLRGESKTMPKTLEEQQSKPQSPDKMRASAKRVLELAPGQKNLKINKRMFSDDIRFAKAYHGSGSTFTKFDTGKIGTGEGAIAFGWGLYFSAKKKVGEWYRNNELESKGWLSQKDIDDYYKVGNEVVYNDPYDGKNNGELVRVLELKSEWDFWDKKGERDRELKKMRDRGENDAGEFTLRLQPVKGGKSFLTSNIMPTEADFKKVTGRTWPGGVYEVELAPKDHEYLMHDLPLNQQSKTVKNALLKTLGEGSKFKTLLQTSKLYPLSKQKSALKGEGTEKGVTGKEFYQLLTNSYLDDRNPNRTVASKQASQYLDTLGVKGVKYVDGSTRYKTTEKSYNYVIFDDKNVDIETRFAKKKGQQTAAELETEWRKRGVKVKPDTKVPKDKLTLGNKKDAGGLYSRESITGIKHVRSDANLIDGDVVRTAKIFERSAGAHAIATRSWNPLKPLADKWTTALQPYSDMLTKHIVAQGTLPDSAKYKALRRVVKGLILNAEDKGRALYDILQNTKQAEVIFKYFTTKNSDANLITDIKERNAAIRAKEAIDEIGKQLEKRGLMRKETRESYEGQYLPRAYLSHLLGKDEFMKAVTRGGVGTDFKYLIARKDIPEGVRKLIMGQIEDPAYLASKATTIPVKDLAILDWLDQIATNDNWVVPKTMVKFDILGSMARLAKENNLSQKIIDSVDLKDTKDVNVSGMWLSKESSRINEMVQSMPDLSEGERKLLRELTTEMAEASKVALNTAETIDTKLYTQIPDQPKYGMLGGMAVRKEIADDIFAGIEITTGDISTVEKWVGDGSLVQKYGRFWKWSKVPANPPSYVRNFSSNLILMQMSGMSITSMPGLFVDGIKDMHGGGKNKGKLYQLAKDLGLTAGGFSQAELGKIESEFKKLQRRLDKKDSPFAVMGTMKGALMTIMDKTTDFYGGIDSLGKMMMINNELQKRGLKVKDLSEYTETERLTLDDAALEAEKWLFDYSNVKGSVRYLRNAPFGAPFMSFTSLVAPLMLETMITKPWKFAPYYALGFAMKEWFKSENDVDDEDLESLTMGASEYLREKIKGLGPTPVIPLPYLDKNGRVQYLDISYIYPWGMFSEMFGELSRGELIDAMKTFGIFGSPVNNIVTAVNSGVDPFSRKKIVDENGTNSEKFADIWWYAFNLTVPSMFHGTGYGNEGYGAVRRVYDSFTGKIEKDGEAKFTMGQSIARLGGMNVTPLAVPEGRNKQMRFEYSQLLKLQRLAKRDIKNMYIMRKPKEDIKEKIEDYREKIKDAVVEFKEMMDKSKPPKQLIKAREAFLRKKKREALAYKNS